MPRPDAWAGSTRKQTLPVDWDRLRRAVLKRDGHRCRWMDNGQRCNQPATDVDHIKDRNDHSMSNLRSLCGPHHLKRTSQQAYEAKMALKALGRLPEEPQPGVIDGPPTPTKFKGF
jgi:5-methylcytosine-specific restriction endonuclease McrA